MDSHVNVSYDRSCAVLDHSTSSQSTGCLVMDLPFSALAANAARSAVAAALTGLGAEDLVDGARLVCSELAANAFRSGSPPLVLTIDWAAGPGDLLDVEILLTDGGSAQVEDHRTEADLPADDAEEGRGLGIVQILAAKWSLDVGTDISRAWCLLRSATRTPAIAGGGAT
ncbi:ATP-binding protein [Streptomyces sp. NPDC059373]